MSKTFRQYNYGTVKGVSMAAAGCGPTALADIIYNRDTSITPAKVATWLYENGVFSSSGTTRIGISRALIHYGFQSFYFTPEHSGNQEWKDAIEVLKASRDACIWGIALTVGTVNGGKDNYWTSGGHFIAITDYDASQNTVYVRDPAGRRDGYQKVSNLVYDCNAIWVVAKAY